MEENRNSRMRVSNRHWDLLLNFADNHPELITQKFNSPNAKQQAKVLWDEIAATLNALGLGEKTVDKWKVALQDWKYKTKAKASEIRKHGAATGGGPICAKKLSEQEERLMALAGWTCVDGDKAVREAGIPQQKSHQTTPSPATPSPARPLVIADGNHPSGSPATPKHSDTIFTADDTVIIEEVGDPGTSSNNKSKSKRARGSAQKRAKQYDRNPSDRLDAFQNETVGVLREISNTMMEIRDELRTLNSRLPH